MAAIELHPAEQDPIRGFSSTGGDELPVPQTAFRPKTADLARYTW